MEIFHPPVPSPNGPNAGDLKPRARNPTQVSRRVEGEGASRGIFGCLLPAPRQGAGREAEPSDSTTTGNSGPQNAGIEIQVSLAPYPARFPLNLVPVGDTE